MTRGQRSYYAFSRSVKQSHGVTHSQALAIRRALADHLGSPPAAAALKQHPRLTSRFVKAVTEKRVSKPKGESVKVPAPKVKPKPGKRPQAPERGGGGILGGGGGGGGRGGVIQVEEPGIEEFDEIDGEGGEYPE